VVSTIVASFSPEEVGARFTSPFDIK